MVNKPPENGLQSARHETAGGTLGRTSEEFEIEDIDVGDTDVEGNSARLRRGQENVRPDADEIVQGTSFSMYLLSAPRLRDLQRSLFQHPS